MADPHFAGPTIFAVGLILAIAVPLILGGSVRRRVATGFVMFAYTCTVMPYLDHIHFMEHPRLGTTFIVVAAVVLAIGLTALIAGIRNRPVLYCALGVAGLGVVSYFLTWDLMRGAQSYLLPLGLFALTIVVCVAVARIFGGYAKGRQLPCQRLPASFCLASFFWTTTCTHGPGCCR